MPEEISDNLIADYFLRLEKEFESKKYAFIDLKESIALTTQEVKEFMPLYKDVDS